MTKVYSNVVNVVCILEIITSTRYYLIYTDKLCSHLSNPLITVNYIDDTIVTYGIKPLIYFFKVFY